MTKPTIANWIALICLGIIWGGSFMGAKLALISFGPMTVALLRVSLASIVIINKTIEANDTRNSFRDRKSTRLNSSH